jgi:phosphoglycolate phosphatase-like HAD superfamily hydrolase
MSDGTDGNALRELQPDHPFFVGLDSDGCAFPSMELKHKECFIPEIVRHFALQPISKYVREAAEFVNLYSQWRGANRFTALLKVMDLLLTRPEVQRAAVEVPRLSRLRAWAERSPSLANPELMVAVRESNDPELRQALDWSNAVNAAIARMVQGVPPFPGVEQILQRLQGQADVVVVSATPGDALQREWEEHRLDAYVRAIAGQEMGSKSEHLKLAAAGKYAPGHILMVGDAPGDWRAAQTVEARFFPIAPGAEEESWQRLQDEGLERFFAGTYAGAYEAARVREFQSLLPEQPPWTASAAAPAG